MKGNRALSIRVPNSNRQRCLRSATRQTSRHKVRGRSVRPHTPTAIRTTRLTLQLHILGNLRRPESSTYQIRVTASGTRIRFVVKQSTIRMVTHPRTQSVVHHCQQINVLLRVFLHYAPRLLVAHHAPLPQGETTRGFFVA